MTSPQREKSQTELEQERSDELLARDLAKQDEEALRRQQAQRAQHTTPPHQDHRPYQGSASPSGGQQQPQPGGQHTEGQYPGQRGSTQVQQQPGRPQLAANQMMCPACFSVNNIKPEKELVGHMCGGCYAVLPRKHQPRNIAASMQQQQSGTQRATPPPSPPQQQQQVTAGSRDAPPPPPLSEPPIPLQQQQLPPQQQQPQQQSQQQQQQQQQPQQQPQQQQQQSQPNVAAPPVPSSGVVVGQIVSQSKQVRCGHCQEINLITAVGDVQFQCGQCGAMNQAFV